jgi:hypothetical protein
MMACFGLWPGITRKNLPRRPRCEALNYARDVMSPIAMTLNRVARFMHPTHPILTPIYQRIIVLEEHGDH